MSKRRTRKQKQQAKYSYSAASYSVSDSGEVMHNSSHSIPSVRTQVGGASLYAYDPGLIRGDLLKTVMVSAIVIGIELALFWYFR